MLKVPFGRSLSYGELASRLRRPKASRAVGGVVGANPLPILVPCHRVLAAGGIGGYGSGLAKKRLLLELEGIPPRGGKPDCTGSRQGGGRLKTPASLPLRPAVGDTGLGWPWPTAGAT